MTGVSKIEWTDHTWNPVVGCSIVSPGCTNCYAMKMAGRLEKMNRSGGSGSNYVNRYDGTTKQVNGNTVWTGKLARAPQKTLLAPLSRKAPTKYFVNSMGDLFHEDCPDEWIDQVFAVMALCPQHTFQVLTKRAGRMRGYFEGRRENFGRCSDALLEIPHSFSEEHHEAAVDQLDLADLDDGGRPQHNVWLGVSCERQAEADERIPLLLQTPAAVRFISAEPLLGAIDVSWQVGKLGWQAAPGDVRTLDWIIAGGESGPNARPMHPDWARALRDQCRAANTAFFFKQWGEWLPGQNDRYTGFGDDRHVAHHQDGSWGPRDVKNLAHNYVMWGANGQIVAGGRPVGFDVAFWAQRVGKKAAGRLLDGVEHNDFPKSPELRGAAE